MIVVEWGLEVGGKGLRVRLVVSNNERRGLILKLAVMKERDDPTHYYCMTKDSMQQQHPWEQQ